MTREEAGREAHERESEWTWANARRWQRSMGMRVTPEQRLAWLEEMIALAHARGAGKVGAGSAAVAALILPSGPEIP